MRYLWDFYPRYRTDRGFLSRNIFTITAHYLRMWDLASAHHVDEFVANSHNVASRIQKHYRREATVIYPPVDVSTGYIAERPQDYYLVVSRLIDYKRIDLAIEACNRLRRPLRIVGDGEQYKKLRRMAGSQIQFLGRLDDSGVRENYAHCRALLFPGEEDFGIVPVEAQSFGRPVIAFNRGGALETVRGVSSTEAADVDMATGVFFGEQHPDSLVQGIKVFESLESRFSPSLIRDSVERFNPARFKSEMLELISFAMDRHQGSVSRQRKLDEVFS
jgi:glycosyltransferase involved in cell wall biosynthesis